MYGATVADMQLVEPSVWPAEVSSVGYSKQVIIYRSGVCTASVPGTMVSGCCGETILSILHCFSYSVCECVARID